MNHKRSKRIVEKVQYIIVPVIILIIWEIAGLLGWIKVYTIPRPLKIVETAFDLTKNLILIQHIVSSVIRVVAGFSIAAILALILGILTALSKKFYKYTDCFIQILKPIPPIAWIPLAILWLGIGESSKLFIICIGAFFPIFSNVVDGIKQIEGKFLEVAEILEIPRAKFIKKVIILGALPSIMTGLRVGLGSAWMCVVAAEMIAATRGIGYMLMDGRSLSRPDMVILGMLIIGFIGKLMNDWLLKLEKKKIYWIRNK